VKRYYVHNTASVLITLLLSLSSALAQQPTIDNGRSTDASAPVAPLAPDAAREGSAVRSLSSPAGEQAPSQAQADTHVLSGAETLGLGSLSTFRPRFDPSLRFSELGQTGIVAGHIMAVSSLGGSLDAEQHWGRYHLTVSYHGAETLYQPSYFGIHYLPYQEGAISQEILLGQWTIRLRDDAFYSWEAGFGGLFTGGPAQSNNGALTNLQPSLASSGTILTGLARQLYNTATGEIDYATSRETTLTIVGSYVLAHFLEPGYISSGDIHGSVGYNHAVGPKNNIALTYDLDSTRYVGTSARLQTDVVQMAFGRKVTGRLAFQLSAGPQLVRVDNLGSSNSKQLSWSTLGSLTHQWTRRTGYSLSYFRGVSAGSGVYFGSNSQTVSAAANHEFTRSWSVLVNGGYAINKALVPSAIFANQFNNWFAGATVNRQLSRDFRLSMTYAYQQQTSGTGGCPVGGCGLPGSVRQFGVTLQWHPLVQGR
jgi:hypothetical protein